MASLTVYGERHIVLGQHSSGQLLQKRSLKCAKSEKMAGMGDPGWRSDESVRLPPECGPGLIPARCHLWVEFVEDRNRIERLYENQLRLMWLPL